MSYFKLDEWNIIEEGYNQYKNRFCESIFSLGNEHMGIRGMTEEGFDGDGLEGSYVSGVYEVEPLKYLWKRPTNPAVTKMMINSTNWIGIKLMVDGKKMKPDADNVKEYKRTLNMQEGTLTREFIWNDQSGKSLFIRFERFLSIDCKYIGAVRCTIKPLNFCGSIKAVLSLTGKVISGYGHYYWDEVNKGKTDNGAFICTKTKVSGFYLSVAMHNRINVSTVSENYIEKDEYVACEYEFPVTEGQEIFIDKLVAVCSSRNFGIGGLCDESIKLAEYAGDKGYEALLKPHKAVWQRIWYENDISISGDIESQQGIRYCIFQMHQTYRGHDTEINIGAKGLTGEMYSGQAFWDTEIYMLPFYLYTNLKAAKNLVMFRYNTLEKARERARLCGYKGARYPMCTIDGDELSGLWEFSEGEIHINAAISYGVYLYHEVSKDDDFMVKYGLEMLIEIARFFADRTVYSEYKKAYVINAVTGPDEYQIMVDNNCYTNMMARWCMEYAKENINKAAEHYAGEWERISEKINFRDNEIGQWEDIILNMYLPFDNNLGIYPQDDSYLGRDYVDPNQVPPEQIPLYKHWAVERITRCTLLKQPDVVLLMYLQNDRFDTETKRKNYDFYTPRTIHDSSLSPCIHSIMASELNYRDEAYKFYLRTARMDIDDYNGNTALGLHTASISGTWMSVVNGFAGMRIKNGMLYFNPYLPKAWTGYSCKIVFDNCLILLEVDADGARFSLLEGEALAIRAGDQTIYLKKDSNRKTIPDVKK